MHSIPRTMLPVLAVTAPMLVQYLENQVCAGFPSPAEDLGAERIDLTSLLGTEREDKRNADSRIALAGATMLTMPRLVQAPNLVMATLWVDWLKAEGIGASVQREFLRSAAGELPPDQCMPEVWIDDGNHEAKALELLRVLRHAPQRRWFCSCGELVEGGFQQCWNCGAMMPL